MSKPTCRMVVWSCSTHASQIQTGLVLLARQGLIRLTQEVRPLPRTHRPPAPHLRDARLSHMLVVINERIRAWFDLHDSFELDEEALERCDVYFKRSFAVGAVPARHSGKVWPLGLNYEVYAGGFDGFDAGRRIALARKPTERLLRMARYTAAFLARKPISGRAGLDAESLCCPPEPEREPRILFMTRVYDPADIKDQPREKIEQRIALNEMRVECILRLRKEFGADRFRGGLQHTEYARRQFRHALLENDGQSRKKQYLSMLRRFPICVASTGLHSSIGWKMGEYVAFSKAIVSEPLRYAVPGGFREGRNFLSFSSTAECVEKIGALMDTPSLRTALMENNWRYYQTWLRPDLLVRKALHTALSYATGEELQPAWR